VHARVARPQRPPFQPGSLLAPWAQQCELGRPCGFARRQADLGVPGRRPEQCQERDVALYVDDAIWHWQGLQWAHLLADGIDELHRFAADLGINRLSYQGPPRTSVPHYDLTAYERRRAIARGAIACSRHEIVVVLRRARSEDRLARMIETRGVVAFELAPRRPPLEGELKM
jgi:hypothetical protein